MRKAAFLAIVLTCGEVCAEPLSVLFSVRDHETGNAIAGVKVSIYSPTVQSAETDSAGIVEFNIGDGVPPERVPAAFVAPWFAYFPAALAVPVICEYVASPPVCRLFGEVYLIKTPYQSKESKSSGKK